MTKRDRAINKQITAIKTLVNDGRLSLFAGVSAIIIKWIADHNLTPDIPERLADALNRGELMPLGDVMARWRGDGAEDDWGDKKAIAIDRQTAETFRRFFRTKDLFAEKDSAVIGRLYQKLLSTGRKKQGGVFYTPAELAARLAVMTGPVDGRSKILDPACGGGALLSAMYDRLRAECLDLSHRDILEEALWGIDTDPLAVIVSRAVLTLKSETYVFPKRIVRADALFDLNEPEWMDFDCVIANPPYIGHKALTGLYMDALRRQYPEVYGDKGDIAYCFDVNAYHRLKDGGTAAFLVSRYFTEARSGEGLRRFLSGETRVRTIIDFNGELTGRPDFNELVDNTFAKKVSGK